MCEGSDNRRVTCPQGWGYPVLQRHLQYPEGTRRYQKPWGGGVWQASGPIMGTLKWRVNHGGSLSNRRENSERQRT